jgi:Uma2 family endonuclease
MNLTEFLQRYDEATFEWTNGEAVQIHELPLGLEQLLKRVSGALSDYAQATGAGEVLVHRPFVLLAPESSNEIAFTRTPDVMFVRQGRLTKDASGTLLTYPDLAVEVISRVKEIPLMYRKTSSYLKVGVEQVWLLDPDMHTLSIHHRGSKDITVLGTRHKMQDNVLFPSLEFNISNLFE